MSAPDEWPASLPLQQMPAESFQDAQTFEELDTLHGPTRRKRKRRSGRKVWHLEVWFTAAQAQAFDAWYDTVVKQYGGAFVIPGWSRSRVIAFAQPYTLAALGTGWRLAGDLTLIRTDTTRCEAFINQTFGNILRDPWDTADVFNGNDPATADVWADDFDLVAIARETC